jgi:simple sugar transport system ATP-binding protein
MTTLHETTTNTPAAPPAVPLLELVGVTKTFGAMTANDNIALSIMPGEIHAILGENGAGKSTLMKMIYGVLAPDAGRIRWNGEDVTIRDPAHARRLGIGMVFQHFSLFETLTVAENISLSIDEKPAALAPRIAAIGERFGLPLDPAALVHSLSVGQRQRAEIIRCLLQAPRLIIMDEPTSVLPPSGVAPLFETIRELAAGGCSVLFISHKLEEIRSLCHRATIMRAGKIVGSVDPTAESKESLARLMIGRSIPHPTRRPAHPGKDAVLELRGLDHEPDDPFGTRLEKIGLEVRPGEILGIAGVSGNGQKEMAALLSGEALLPRAERDRIRIAGVGCGDADAGQRRRMGFAFVPEERNGRGAVPEMSLTLNALLTGHGAGLVRRGFVAQRHARRFAESCIAAMNVRCAGPQSEARSLSGGNLQKFIIGREIRLAPKVLVASQPTWGVDVGAAAAIRQELITLRDKGVGILIISEELEELFEVADRLQVLFRGRLSPSLDRAEADTARIGDYMTGGFLSAPSIATAA